MCRTGQCVCVCVCVRVHVLVHKAEPGIDLLPWLYPGEGVERERGLKEPQHHTHSHR